MVVVICVSESCPESGIEKRGMDNGLPTLCGNCLELCAEEIREDETDADPAN